MLSKFINYIKLEVESDLPEDLKNEAVLCFEAAISNNLSVGDAVSKVQKDVLSKCDEVFKGKRYKGFIKFDYDTNCISIQVFQIEFSLIVIKIKTVLHIFLIRFN
jgi:hypothetical protein